jgi:hypothetical protein
MNKLRAVRIFVTGLAILVIAIAVASAISRQNDQQHQIKKMQGRIIELEVINNIKHPDY